MFSNVFVYLKYCLYLYKQNQKVMIKINPIENLDEVLRYLREPKQVSFDLSWNGDAISYYRSKRQFLPKVCPVCNQSKSLIVVRVICQINGKWKYYFTPVCKECWKNRSKDMNEKAFFVARYFLCSNMINR